MEQGEETEKKLMEAHSQWTPEEFQAWLAANLSTNTDLKRWTLLALRLLKGLPVEPDALLTEAVARTLGGVRKFNREHPIEANLYETMRSIASSWHKARKRKPEVSLEDLISSGEDDQDPLEVLAAPEGSQPSPEQELQFKQEMDGILALFEDREDAQLVIMGRAEGLKGTALAECAGLDQASLASVLRLISRRLSGHRREV
jgi:DNA-directed RNA polymerase specialized sigma24 family protein